MSKRHGRLETATNPDGTFFLRLKAANGKTLMHSEQLTGRQVKRARQAIVNAINESVYAEMTGLDRVGVPEPVSAACRRER